MNKTQRKIVNCCSDPHFTCKDCEFDRSCSESDKIKWLCKEYIPRILSDNELNLIEALNKVTGKKYKYIARDTVNVVRFFETKPNRNELNNYYNLEDGYVYIGIKFGLLFPNIKFEDGLYDIENKCFIK